MPLLQASEGSEPESLATCYVLSIRERGVEGVCSLLEGGTGVHGDEKLGQGAGWEGWELARATLDMLTA